MRRRRTRKLKSASRFIIAGIVTVIAVVVVLNGLAMWKEATELARRNAADSKDASPESVEAAFQAFLAESSIEQLINGVNNMSRHATGSSEFIPKRVYNLQSRQTVADRILELDPNENQRKFAISTKLQSAIELEKLAQENDLVFETSFFELKQLAREYIDSSDPEIKRLATVADLLYDVRVFSIETEAQNRVKLNRMTAEKIRDLAAAYPDDIELAGEVFELQQLVLDSCKPQEAKTIAEAFRDGYRDSMNSQIEFRVEQIDKKLLQDTSTSQ